MKPEILCENFHATPKPYIKGPHMSIKFKMIPLQDERAMSMHQ